LFSLVTASDSPDGSSGGNVLGIVKRAKQGRVSPSLLTFLLYQK
jgi:hypothetical protein